MSKIYFNRIKSRIMAILIYAIGLILVTVWSIGFIGYGIGGMIHLLLVVAFIPAILGFFLDKREPRLHIRI